MILAVENYILAVTMRTNSSLTACRVLLALALAFVFWATPLNATTFQTAKRSHITNLHHIDDDLFIWSQKYIQDGVINGDLFSGSSEATVNGQVTGSANLGANNIVWHGTVDGSLRCFANGTIVSGSIGKSLMVMGSTVSVDRSATIGRDAHLMATTISYEGTCLGKLTAKGDDVTIGGSTDGDMFIRSDHITFVPPVVIKGNLLIETNKEVTIDTASGVSILGTVTIQKPTKEENEEEAFGFSDVMLMIAKLFAAFLFGVLLIRLFRRYAQQSVTQLRFHFAQSLAVGMLSLIIMIVCGIILVVSLGMSLLGLILISSDAGPGGAVVLGLSILLIPITSVATVCGAVLFYIGKIITALVVGFWISSKFSRQAKPVSALQLLLGLLLLSTIFMIPFGGWWIYMFVSIIGIGSIVLAIKEFKPYSELQPPTPPPPPTPPSPLQM